MEPSKRAEEHLVDVLRYRIPHIIDPIAKAPSGGLSVRIAAIHSSIAEGFARFAKVMLTIAVSVGKVEDPIPLPRITRPRQAIDSEVLIGLPISQGVHGIALAIGGDDEVGIEIVVGAPRMADTGPLREVGALRKTIFIKGSIGRLLRNVPSEGVPVEDLPLVRVVGIVRKFLPIRSIPP